MARTRYLLVETNVTVPVDAGPQAGPEVFILLDHAPLDPLKVMPVLLTEPVSFGPGAPVVHGVVPIVMTQAGPRPCVDACVLERDGQWMVALDSSDDTSEHTITVVVYEVD